MKEQDRQVTLMQIARGNKESMTPLHVSYAGNNNIKGYKVFGDVKDVDDITFLIAVLLP